MEAESNVPASGDNASEAVKSEAWRVFLQVKVQSFVDYTGVAVQVG